MSTETDHGIEIEVARVRELYGDVTEAQAGMDRRRKELAKAKETLRIARAKLDRYLSVGDEDPLFAGIGSTANPTPEGAADPGESHPQAPIVDGPLICRTPTQEEAERMAAEHPQYVRAVPEKAEPKQERTVLDVDRQCLLAEFVGVTNRMVELMGAQGLRTVGDVIDRAGTLNEDVPTTLGRIKCLTAKAREVIARACETATGIIPKFEICDCGLTTDIQDGKCAECRKDAEARARVAGNARKRKKEAAQAEAAVAAGMEVNE